MQQKLKILFISSEVAPFAKTGGLADVSYALPKVLREMGHDVRIFMPKYGLINERRYILREVIRLKDIKVPVGDKVVLTNVKSSFLPKAKVQVYFVGNKEYFNRDGFYTDPKTNKDWQDNAERFSFFSRSALEILKRLHWQPDIIHCNDWQTALIPFFLKRVYREDMFFKKTYTLLTLHNIAFQGIFDSKMFEFLNIGEEQFKQGSDLEFFGRINFLKAGILNADLINTVSKAYAREIQESEEFGFGLQKFLSQRKNHLFGILNGVDYNEWNPETDKFIPFNYSKGDLSGKLNNKKSLLESLSLPFDEKIPVLATISRLTDQKGFDIISQAVEDMLKLDLQYIILGVGEPKYHSFFQQVAKKYPDKFSINLKFDNELAHLIEAGADLFLMPSKFEPCGLNQIYSLKYGTIPIVRETGGLADTIKKYSPDTGRGYGFVFQEYSTKALLNQIKQAIQFFHNKDVWKKLMSRAMKVEFTWEKAAEKYVELYRKLVE